jgi:outer membrane usher protein
VKGLPRVRVYADNQLIGTTDGAGNLIIPSLRPFEANRIRVDESDLPLDVQLAKAEILVRPFGRSAAVADFAAVRERGVLLKVALEDGAELPSGAVVQAMGTRFTAVTGGEVYIPNLSGRTTLDVAWEGRSCSVEVTVPDSDDPQLRIEGLICRKAPAYAAR